MTTEGRSLRRLLIAATALCAIIEDKRGKAGIKALQNLSKDWYLVMPIVLTISKWNAESKLWEEISILNSESSLFADFPDEIHVARSELKRLSNLESINDYHLKMNGIIVLTVPRRTGIRHTAA
jgi:hypothetical protein